MIKAVRGTRDLLPPETALWNFVEAAARDVFRAYNFQEIRTPIFEETQLFARSVGEETDIVSKEMYTWLDGKTAEMSLVNAWLEKHRVTNPYALPEIASGRPDLVVEAEGSIVAVEAKFRPDAAALRQLYVFSKIAQDFVRPDASRLRLVLIVPSKVVQASFRENAQQQGIELEEVDVEPPQSLTLRPENTASVVRAYIEHRLSDRGLNKLFYIGPQFRRERPQKGRHRQFYQIGAEVIGPPSSGSEKPLRDAEVIEMLAVLLDRLEVKDWRLHLNSIGCPNDRATYNEALRNALTPVVSRMCADCQRRAKTNPLRVFDCKVPEDQPIIEKLPVIAEYLDDKCKEHFDHVKALLTKGGVDFQINPRLVRGLDYYTRTAFEFTHGALGAQNALVGGGRYDGLSELLGGEQAPGVGFAMGEDRLILALQHLSSRVLKFPDAYIAPVGAGMNREALKLASELRVRGLVVELGDRSFRLGKLLERASKMNARFAVIVREDESGDVSFTLKNLATAEQVSVPRTELAQRIQVKS